MAAPVIIYINTTAKAQIASFLGTIQPGSQMVFEAGDNVPLQLHFLQQNPSSGTQGQLPFSYIDPATVTPVSLAIGTIGAVPTAGTFTVTYGANTTAALAFNITATALATALNALASVTSAGGVTITGNPGGPFRITFVTPGVITTQFTVNAGELSPTSQGIVIVAVTGATGVNEVQTITLLANPAAFQNTWTNTYGAIAVTQLQTGGVSGSNSIQRITVPQGTYAGSYSLIWSGAQTTSIPFNASATVVQNAFAALAGVGAGQVSVVASSPTTWDITFTGTLGGAAQTAIVANGVGLLSPMYLAGTLNLLVQGIFDLLAGQIEVTPTLQIQQGTPGNINTVLQTEVTLNNTLIVGTPTVPFPPLGSIYGFTAIPAGSNVVAVSFGVTLAGAPTGILPTVMMDGVTSILQGNVDFTSITTTGFNFILNSVPAIATSKLFWVTLP